MAAVKFFSTYTFGQIIIKPVKPLSSQEKGAFRRLLSIGRSFFEQLARKHERVAQEKQRIAAEKQRIAAEELELEQLSSKFSFASVSLPELRVGGAMRAVKSLWGPLDARLETRAVLNTVIHF